MLGFLTVHSRCASASPHLTPCFPQPLLSSYPSLAPSTRLPLSHISGRPSLAPASALLFLSSPLVYSLPSAVGFPKTPLSVVSAFSLFSPAFLSRPPHHPFCVHLSPPSSHSPSESLRLLHPPHMYPNWISGLPFTPTAASTPPASTPSHPPGPPASCPAPKIRARFPGTKQEKSE